MGIGGEIEHIFKNFKSDAANEVSLSANLNHEEDAFEEYLKDLLNGGTLDFANDDLRSGYFYNVCAACIIRCIECYKCIGRIASIEVLASEYENLSKMETIDKTRRKRDVEQRLEELDEALVSEPDDNEVLFRRACLTKVLDKFESIRLTRKAIKVCYSLSVNHPNRLGVIIPAIIFYARGLYDATKISWEKAMQNVSSKKHRSILAVLKVSPFHFSL
ncbi:hypothetical protein GUITHDRAFT_109168 [Guillardia theta CCMP2712]|uniref:Uncharacterized protein n=1 Tax=Guillardia theta (strain CCMP2712) TaxID=905079 RepID=L1J990_GUITC|nr:hypothetical protein GUITHDRAFT_109168 [Guillardia theta CCMP2712]EKX45123.1 hypothetical protein GUITHDRAFT_109168 [Guillardia theta CCMP2712]|eukprot:XP_005832103.1 hypothetical protein GUITHDRAFT_109168 [Guillardia theta CCMP2712]